MKKEFMLGALCLGMVLVAVPLRAADAPVATAPSGDNTCPFIQTLADRS